MISVLMGGHRMDAFVFPATDSILGQQGVEFELVVVANGKDCDAVASAIEERYAGEPRIRVVTTPIGQLAHALNVGLSVASFGVVARMDSDDIAHSNRLKSQLKYLRAGGYDVVGSAVRLIDREGVIIGERVPPTGQAINRWLPFRSCFIHPTIIARKSIIIELGGYSGGFNCEDYDLWLRMRRHGVLWNNMDDRLLDYRVHGATAQRKLLGYAETAGLMVRELALTKRPVWFAAACMAFAKALVRPR